jgi:hypothetical protein
MKWLYYLKNKRPTLRLGEPAPFAVGERVSIRKGSPQESGNAPNYVRGKSGIVGEICAPSPAGPHGLRAHRRPASAKLLYAVFGTRSLAGVTRCPR